MTDHWQQQLSEALESHPELLTGIARGIEKESLRITADGQLSRRPHPAALGSALTHSSITTDYSEALLEFITSVDTDIERTLTALADIHTFVYQRLGDELLWCASMPCIVAGDAGIPVAEYGTSNSARMKTVYRLGLGHRYGRTMQTISGIHYNFSMPTAYWEQAAVADGHSGPLQDYITNRYLGMIRNFHRWSWLIIYLLGASPAVCASFLRGRAGEHSLQPFDEQGYSLHLPYATSLRMGGLGYNSDAQSGLNVCYNSLDSYIGALKEAILRPHPAYSGYPAGENGVWEQLSDSLLQIENEFYSTIRPKRVAGRGQTPLAALSEGGIEYVEVRCIDVNPFLPLGIDDAEIRFLDSFLLHCLLMDSPPCDFEEQQMLGRNMEAVVNRGRQPGLELETESGNVPMQDLATKLLDDMRRTATQLDAAFGDGRYVTALAGQRARVEDPTQTPSARILDEMRERGVPFFRLALGYSERWARYFRERGLSPESTARLELESSESLEAQRELEASDNATFEQHLDAYFSQYRSL